MSHQQMPHHLSPLKNSSTNSRKIYMQACHIIFLH
jgi:hypothetical protein